MNKKWHYLMVLLLIGASTALGTVPITAEVIEVRKIWDKGTHNAFTDLVRWNEKFYCAFREGRGHVSTDGKIRVLESKDTNLWESVVLVALDGYDLRDAHLSVTPDGKLMLMGGAAPRKKDNQAAPTGTFVCFSKDSRQWSKPEIVVEPGRWLWRVTWHKENAYGVSYAAKEGMPYLDLLISSDGINYYRHVAKLFEQGYPSEVTLRFDTDGTCYALVRRNQRDDELSSALLGVSRPSYTKWRWHDLGVSFNGFGGPNFIHIPGGHWIGAGRMHEGGAHTALTYIDVENGTMTKLLRLPSGGDTSYPGLVWHNDMLYISYYSSHEGKTCIYLAKVKVQPKAIGDEERFGADVNPTGDPIGGSKGYRHLVNQGDYQVETAEELLTALKQAKAEQVVYVCDKAEIDLTGKQEIVIPGGVTLASGRGRENSQGALIHSSKLATSPLFLTGGENVRITGLRLRGPDPKRRMEQMRHLHKEGQYYSIPNSDGIISTHAHLKVDNCELWGWSYAAVFLERGALKAQIHHNYIHHNQRSGLGYGVCLDQVDALIEANLFDWCHHHIAGTGRPGTIYEARYNLVLENANGRSFDMRGGKDRKDDTDIAGDLIQIHHNTFQATGVRAIVIWGRPIQNADIHHNWFLHPNPQKAVLQTNATGNMNVRRNQFTMVRTLSTGEKKEREPPDEEFPHEIVDFAAYKGNPLFSGTGRDTWDRNIRERGYILREGDIYHLWYTGYNKDRSKTLYLGYATSADGLKWTRHPDNPIFDESWVEDMQVVKHQQMYYMFAEGIDDIAHMLTSTDKVRWEDHGSIDIRYSTGEPLTPGPYGTPTVWVEGETWYLFYERNDEGIWLATSTDREVWKNVQDEPVISKGPEDYDRHAVALNQVIKYKGRYYGYYHASAHRPWRDWTTNVAVSKDLVHWKKYPNNPIVTGNKSSGILIHDGNRYRLYTMHPDVRVYFPRDSR